MFSRKLFPVFLFILILTLFLVGCSGSNDVSVPNYSVSGTVTNAGSPVSGVTITLSGTNSTTTGSDGTYRFSILFNNNTYTFTPSKTGLSFTPASRSVTITGADVTGQDFSATAGVQGSAN